MGIRYVRELDGLRAVAALVVVAFHCRVPGTGGGFIGVDVFFVLSGFLITSILRQELIETSRIDLWRFYVRRALRLWPPLILMLGAYVAFAPMLLRTDDVFRDAALAGLYLSDYARAFAAIPDYLSHTWSLSVEEHFYMIWPAVILLTGRRSDRAASAILIALFVLATAWRIADAVIWQDWARTYYRFDTRMSGLLIGAAVAVLPSLATRRIAEVSGQGSLTFIVLAIMVGSWKNPSSLTWIGIMVDLAAAGLVWSLASGHRTTVGSILSSRPLVYLGLISYSIYLWHYPISRAARSHLDPWTAALIVVPLSIALAVLSYELIERPLKAWQRSRIVPSPA